MRVKIMTNEDLTVRMMEIAQSLQKWLEETAEQFNMPVEDLQEIVHRFLNG